MHEGVDTSTPNGRLVFGIFASIAEFERELIRDRVNSSPALARSRGKHLGRPSNRGSHKNWIDNVEVIAAARVGAETVNYVSNIYKYYVAYKLFAVQAEQLRKAKETLQQKPS